MGTSSIVDGHKSELILRQQRWIRGERTLLMGIVNVTPDSFSGDGVTDAPSAIAHALQQIARGADIIDIGGESTRPGYVSVSEHDEARRVVPVIEEVRKQSQIPISIDTTKPQVLQQSIDAGADLLNCVNGLPDELLDVVVERGIPVVISHWQKEEVSKNGIVADMLSSLQRAAERAVKRGVAPEKIILDPGIGFGKNPESNLLILSELHKLTQLGYFTLLGTSRKSFIGKVANALVDDRRFGTAATISLGIASGIDIVRVHDVAEMKQVVALSDAIHRGWRPAEWSVQ